MNLFFPPNAHCFFQFCAKYQQKIIIFVGHFQSQKINYYLCHSRSPPPFPQAISESDDEDESTPPEETQKVTSTVSEPVTPETNLGAAEAPVTTESTKTAGEKISEY